MVFKEIQTEDIFQCKKCGDCCRGYGGTCVTEKDIITIADYVNTKPDSFVADYCQMSGKKPVLAQGKNRYCVFWDGLCMIHPVKPHMCRTWPFINSLLVDINNWYIMAQFCPGMRTDISPRLLEKYIQRELSDDLTKRR
ncbi:MAG TPA: YkgJ family cysteine cluster protein [Desulfobacteraceae bacterium]|nr:YkgJ family cysteine cluster protein [Desulfobacteraceae bacterium]